MTGLAVLGCGWFGKMQARNAAAAHLRAEPETGRTARAAAAADAKPGVAA